MNNFPDWTDYYNQNSVAKSVSNLIDDIILEIHSKKILDQQLFLDYFSLELIYRWNLHVSINLFFERLLKVLVSKNKKIKIKIPIYHKNTNYYSSIIEATESYYYDENISYSLIDKLAFILEVSVEKNSYNLPTFVRNKKKLTLFNLIKKLYKSSEEYFVVFTKPNIVGDYTSKWFKYLFPFGKSIDFYEHMFDESNNKINKNIRTKLENINEDLFKKHIVKILNKFDEKTVNDLSKEFSNWIDKNLPISIVEGLSKRYKYYEKLLSNWKIKQVHSFSGYNYNENFKIFALISKKNGSSLIGHLHGANNYCWLYKDNVDIRFLDYYVTYGKSDYGINESEWIKENLNKLNYKLLEVGSVNFNKIPKWNKKIISNNINLLYPSGPLMDFATDLEEISYQKIYNHRINIYDFFKIILSKYKNLTILYKPFPGTYKNDPIKDNLKEFINDNRIKLCENSLNTMYNKVDLVMWDSISTGFVESIISKVPTFVFNSEHEYKLTSKEGKNVNDELTLAGVQVFNIQSALNSFEKIISNLDLYLKESEKAMEMHKKNMGLAVTRQQWHNKFKLLTQQLSKN